MSYHEDRFYAAVSVLSGHGHIKQRLMSAYEEHLGAINEDELPTSMHEPFQELQRQMHRVAPLNGEGPIRATVRKMSAEEAGECAVSIVAMYRELVSQGECVDLGLQRDRKRRKSVPTFLMKSV
jgi:hypothetical protein